MRVRLDPPRAIAAPGDVVAFVVHVHNDTPQSLLPVLTVRGIDPSLVIHLDQGVELVPGARGVSGLEVQVPHDAVSGDLRVAVEVADADGLHEPALVIAELGVGQRPPVSIELDPPAVRGRRSARLATIVTNHGVDPVHLALAAEGDGVDVRFHPGALDLAPGETRRVATRLRRTARTWFRELRHGVLIDVRSAGPPVSISTTFLQRPSIPPLLLRMTAILTIIALWATAVVVVNDRVLNREEDLLAAADVASEPTEGANGAVDPGGTDDPGASEGDGSADDAADQGGAPVVVQGEVTGPRQPAGTQIVVERISFGDEGTTDAGTKVAALTPIALPVGRVIDRIATETDDRGRFRIASGLATSAFYRVTALRPGFEVGSLVVETAEEPADHDVEIALASAPGGMSGRVTDAVDGSPLGGADVIVTGGDLVYRTTTATDGAVGTWTLDGMAALPAYNVSVREPRHATASVVRSLEGGQRLTGVDLQLVPDLGTIVGKVSYRGKGVGAITVTLAGEDLERTTTTLTDVGLEGTFDLPALPFGIYALTFSAPGWLTQTAQVIVDGGNIESSVDLVPSTAQVQGIVEQEVVAGGCVYPTTAERDQLETRRCGGVGVSLEGTAGIYRTTTATGTGSFALTSIPPGVYTATFSRTGYVSQFLTIELLAGDIVALPGSATTTTGGSSARAARAAVARAEDVLPIIMRLVPPVAAGSGELRAVLRRADAPSDTFDPPPGTQVTIDGQSEARVEALGDGAYLLTGLLPGSQTVRVVSPGFDEFTRLVQVRADGPSDGGNLPLTPLATLAMRVTDGAEFPIGGADVFVSAGSDTDDTNLDAFTDASVRECTVGRDAAGRWRLGFGDAEETLDGLCATATSDGDVSLRQALGTGSYRIITPVNEVDEGLDTSTPEARQVRAGTVPLDHLQLERLVEVQSGETSRLELRARRYPVIEGRIRIPTGNGFTNAGPDAFTSGDVDGLRSFPSAGEYLDDAGIAAALGVALTPSVDGEPVSFPEGLLPRISYGPADGLPEGVYRVNRVLPSTANELREYTLGFFGLERRSFAYQGANALTTLSFGETRTANAVLIAPPVPVDVRVVRQRTDQLLAVPNPVLTITGTSEFTYDGGNLISIVKTVTYEPGESGAGRVVDDEGQEVRFVAGEPIEIEVSADGFEPLSYNEELVEDVVIDLVMIPLRRDLRGSVQIVPVAASTPAALGDVTLTLEPLDEDFEPPVTAGLTTAVDGDRLTFEFADVVPGEYRVLATGPDLVDFTSQVLDLPPGPSDVPVNFGPDGAADTPPPFLLDRLVDLTVTVQEVFPVGGQTLAVSSASVSLLLDGSEVAVGTTNGSGVVTFTDLLGGPDREYRLGITKSGYMTPAAAGDAFQLDTIDNDEVRELVRYGAIRANLTSRLADDETPAALVDATVTLLDTAGALVPGVAQATSDNNGLVTFPATAEIPAGDYQLRIEAANHDPRVVPVTVADATVTNLGVIEVRQRRAALSGVVHDATDTGPPLPNVRVTARNPDNLATVYATDITGADGVYSLADLPPRDLVIRFEEFADPGATTETSRRVKDITITLTAGQAAGDRDVTLLREIVAISGTVRQRSFASDPSLEPVESATVTATCRSDSCGQGTQLVTTTGPGGGYAFDVVTVGTYEVDAVATGFEPDAQPGGSAVVVRFGENQSGAVVDLGLTATPITVPVDVTGLGGSLAGLTVRATYFPPAGESASPSTTADPRFVFTTTSGPSASLRLSPGDWRIETVGADAETTQPRPHEDRGIQAQFVAGVTPDIATIPLTPYVEVRGTVRSRPHVNATDTALDGASATPQPETGRPTPYPSGTPPVTTNTGGWRVLLPPSTGAARTWRVVATHPDHAGGTVAIAIGVGSPDIVLSPTTPGVTITSADGTLPAARSAVDGGIALTARPVTQPVLVTSQSGGTLTGVGITATWNGGGTPPPGNPYTTTGTSAASAVDLLLAPGSWRLTTTGAEDLLPTHPPHQNDAGTDVAVVRGSAPGTVTLSLVRYASIEGTVATLDRRDDAPVATALAIVTTSAAGARPESPSNVTNDAGTRVAGAWRVWVPDPADATINFAQQGYGSETIQVPVAAFGGGRAAVEATQVVLEGTPRTVQVLVVSSVGATELGTVTVTATSSANAAVTRTAVTGPNGIATFTDAQSLQPGTWNFTTSGGPALTEPHNNLTTPASRQIPSGGTDPVQLTNNGQRLTMVRYALVTGLVGTRDVPGGTLTPTNGVGVSTAVPGGTPFPNSAIVTGPSAGTGNNTGRWRVWLPDPASVTISFALTGYATDPISPVPPTSGRDVTVTETVAMLATPRTTAVTVVSDADGSIRPDVDVTATRVGGGVPAVTVTTSATGIATFTQGSRLAPGAWRFTTARAPAGSPPHKDLVTADDVERTIPVGDAATVTFANTDQSAADARVELVRFASVTGIVATAPHVGADSTPTNVGVTLTATPATTVIDPIAADGTWRVWLPDPAAVTASFTKIDHANADVSATTASFTARTAATGTTVLVAVPRTVAMTLVSSLATAHVAGVTVTATLPTGTTGVGPFSVTADDDGVATFTGANALAPTTWAFTTTGGPALRPTAADAAIRPHENLSATNRTVPVGPEATSVAFDQPPPAPPAPGDPPPPPVNERLELTAYAEITGTVSGPAAAPIQGATVTATAPAQSGGPSAAGGAWRGWTPNPTTSATFTFSQTLYNTQSFDTPAVSGDLAGQDVTLTLIVIGGPTTLAPPSGTTDTRTATAVGPTTPPAVEPSGIRLTGVVTRTDGAPIEGALVRARSATGETTTTTDATGRYVLGGLAPDATSAITFTPPPGVPGVSLTRWVLPGGAGDLVIGLDQEVPASLGNLDVLITGGVPGDAYTVVLREVNPFPTLDEDGELTASGTLDDTGAATAAFTGLLPGDDVSVPQNRLTLEVTTTGAEPRTVTGLDVTSGATTRVPIVLTPLAPLTRDVILTLVDTIGPVTDITALLRRDGLTINATNVPGSNVYAFANVPTGGSWTLVVPGYSDARTEVAPGTAALPVSLSLTPLTRTVDLLLRDAEGSVVAGASPVLTDADRTVTGVETTPGTYRFADLAPGAWNLSGIAGFDDSSLIVPVGTDLLVTSLLLSPPPVIAPLPTSESSATEDPTTTETPTPEPTPTSTPTEDGLLTVP